MTTDVDTLLEMLDEDQRKAVLAPPTPLVIVAAAGAGKTATLTRRVAYQLHEKIAPADQFFISTFTRAAADEMRERIYALVGEMPDLRIGTFHSLCFRLINDERRVASKEPYGVCKESEKTWILRDLLGKPSRDCPEALNIDVDIAMVGNYIGTWKNELIHHDDEEVFETADESPKESPMGAAARVYSLYEAKLRLKNKIDFDDMLLKAYDVLFQNEGARLRAQQRWTAFFTDENQDSNGAQYAILQLIAPPEKNPNITVVGDPRQSIYEFRGAKPELMQSFEKIYPHAQRMHLVTNYRSSEEVIRRANKLISPMGLPDQKPVRGMGASTIIQPFDDAVEQGTEIARLVSEARDNGYKGGDIGILIRTNAQSAQLERGMVAAGLPYWCKNGGFFDRMEVGDIVAYLRLASSRDDAVSLKRIINRPTRYLGEAFVEAAVKTARLFDGDLVRAVAATDSYRGKALSSKQKKSAEDLADLLDFIGDPEKPMSPFMAIHRILEWTDYTDWLKKTSGSEDAVDDSRIENIKALENVAAGFGTIADLLAFIDTTKLLQQETNDATVICTGHAAKGREWPMVIVSNFYDNSFPHKRAVMEGALDGERRLAYVAVTRAKDVLVLAVPFQDDKGASVGPSRFITEMGLDLPSFDFATDEEAEETLAESWWGDIFKEEVDA